VAPPAFGEAFGSRVRAYLPTDCKELLQSYEQLIQGDNFVAFYGRKLPFFEFSNFWRAPITLRGKVWPTSEHYFQAMKFEGTPHEEEIRNTAEPMEIASMGRDRSRSGSNKLGILLMIVRDVLRSEVSNPPLSIPEFMYIKFLAEEQGYRISLTGNHFVGDSRNYDIYNLERSIRDPFSAEERLFIAYNLGSPGNGLVAVPWEMRDDPTTYNEIRFSMNHSDGSEVSIAERDRFEDAVYQGLAKPKLPAPTDKTSREFTLQFYERSIRLEEQPRSGLITTGLKMATPN
jgi:hypothetical protein